MLDVIIFISLPQGFCVWGFINSDWNKGIFMKGKMKYLLTGVIVAVAVIVVLFKYWDYVTNPWTRDGQVRAQVVQITPRVSAPIVKLPIEDNQLVKAGDLLFAIDPRTFEATLEQKRAELANTRDEIEALEKQVEAAQADVEAAGANIKRAQAAIRAYALGIQAPAGTG
jgi:multidrug resistance efflux pump